MRSSLFGRRARVVACLLALVAPAAVAPLFAQNAIQVIGNGVGRIDWTVGTITASGYGFVHADSGMPRARMKIGARSAAMADAYRNLAETVQGIQVTNTTTVREMIVQDDSILGVVQGFVQGARPLSITYTEDNGGVACTVEMEAPLGAAGGFASAILPYVQSVVIDQIPAQQRAAANLNLPPIDMEAVRASFVAARADARPSPGPGPAPGPVQTPAATPVPTPLPTAAPTPMIPDNPPVVGDDSDGPHTRATPAPDDVATRPSTGGAPNPAATPAPTLAATPAATPASAPTPTATPIADAVPAIVTGVLVDARGQTYRWNLFPEVRTENGFAIFDVTALGAAEAAGFFSPFAYTIESGSENERTRRTPAIVEAVKTDGNAIVIRNEDGKRLLELNRERKLLQNGRLLFVIVAPAE